MRVEVHLLSQSKPIKREVENVYIKEGMYCLLLYAHEGAKKVEKYPMVNIFRAVEDY